jgi:type I restriction enzyme M protein
MAEVKEIESKLWAMANALRGSMDASEFKNYILAFMFYRYLSEQQEAYLLDQGLLDVAEGETANQAYMRQAAEELDDYIQDIASSLGYAINPENTWASLMDKVTNNTLAPEDFALMFDNFNKNAELNSSAAQDFKGVFDDVNLGDSRLGSNTNARAKSLTQIVELVDGIEFQDDSGKDVLGTIYEYLIGQFASTAGKKGGEFYTPHEVSQILAKLTTLNAKPAGDQFTVYDPTMGSGSLLLTVQQELPGGDVEGAVHFYGQELNFTTYNLARMNLMMRGVNYANMNLSNADTLESDWPDGMDSAGVDHPRSFDAVVANPPYSAKWDNSQSKMKDPRFAKYGKLAPSSKADYAFILHSLYHLNDTGTMAIVLPHGVLFRGSAEGTIREKLIADNNLDAVIGLPGNLFYGTSIPTAVLVFKKNRENTDVLFIDASNDFEKGKNQNRLTQDNIDKIINTYVAREDVEKYAHVATLDEIKDNDYNLNIPRYVDTFEEEAPIDLAEVKAEIENVDREIAELQAQFDEMVAQLVETDSNDK